MPAGSTSTRGARSRSTRDASTNLMMRALSPKQARFVAEYLVDLNGTQAAIRAGYSPKTANEQAAQLLAKLSISESVQAGQSKRLNKLDITADRVLSEFARIGFSDLRNVFDASGALLPPGQMTDDTAASIASVEVTKETTRKHGDAVISEAVTKVKAWDKIRALEALAKNLGLLKDRTVLENPDGSPVAFTLNLARPHADV